MKTGRMLKIGLVILVVLVLGALSPLVLFHTAGLRTPARVPAPAYWPTAGWRASSPEEQGFDSARLAQGLRSLQEKQARIDSLLLIRDGYVVVDAKFSTYAGTFPHDLASVTKSITTTLVAIAAEKGLLDLDAPVVSFFTDRTIAKLDARKARMTVRHLVAMRNGMESGCYDGDEPTLDAMRSQPDWVQAALDRPMVAEPGSRNCYDSPGMHLLSAILQKATGMTELDFARQVLFEPLGIHTAIWDVDPQGYTRGWGDLHLYPGDAAKIGLLWLQRGKWDGNQIVSAAWVLDSVRPHSLFVKGDIAYGYGWWISGQDYLATGRGGQTIRVLASRNTILVVTGAYYDFSAIEKWFYPALLSLKFNRPANPAGQAALAAVLADLAQSDLPASAAPSADLVRSVSGRTYNCEPNPINAEWLRLSFADPAAATLTARLNGVDYTWTIGTAGHYLQAPNGEAFRGYWIDASTFQYDIFDIGLLHRRLYFEGDAVQVTLPELELTAVCQAQR
jgi:CubicO group peptidase (beta-lactamase class C family)